MDTQPTLAVLWEPACLCTQRGRREQTTSAGASDLPRWENYGPITALSCIQQLSSACLDGPCRWSPCPHRPDWRECDPPVTTLDSTQVRRMWSQPAEFSLKGTKLQMKLMSQDSSTADPLCLLVQTPRADEPWASRLIAECTCWACSVLYLWATHSPGHF